MPSGRDEPPAIHTDADRLVVSLPGATTIVFRRAGERCRVRLGFGRTGSGPDVSFQPATVDRVVRDRARIDGVDPNRWCGRVVTSLHDWHGDLDGIGTRPDQLTAVVGAVTHPLLARLYRSGLHPLDDVPRWASAVLGRAEVAGAVETLTGRRANRRVVRALGAMLATSEAGGLPVDRLALAVAAAPGIGDDDLANLLEVTLDGGIEVPTAPPLTVADVELMRGALGWFPVRRRVALLTDVATRGATQRFVRTASQLRWVIDITPRPLPVRLEELEQLCARIVPTLPEPRPPADVVDDAARSGEPRRTDGPRRPARRAVATEPRVPHPLDRVQRADPTAHARRAEPARRAPVALIAPEAPVNGPRRWSVPTALGPVVGLRVDDLSLCVPTSVAELDRWSRGLGNCLDTFGPAVGTGRSWVIGVRRDDQLIGAVEVDPTTRRLRQASGPRNRSLPTPVYDRVVTALGEAGVLRVHRRPATDPA